MIQVASDAIQKNKRESNANNSGNPIQDRMLCAPYDSATTVAGFSCHDLVDDKSDKEKSKQVFQHTPIVLP
jgi:hypothetical protein